MLPGLCPIFLGGVYPSANRTSSPDRRAIKPSLFINPACVCLQIDQTSAVLASAVPLEAAENKTVNGDSYVGNVNSNGGQAKFDRSNGKANDENGVGFSTR